MRGTLSFSSSNSEDAEGIPEKINENDPKHLRQVIAGLIDKSKSIIETLETTVSKLEKTEKERDFWKNHYLQFRTACFEYVDSDKLEYFR